MLIFITSKKHFNLSLDRIDSILVILLVKLNYISLQLTSNFATKLSPSSPHRDEQWTLQRLVKRKLSTVSQRKQSEFWFFSLMVLARNLDSLQCSDPASLHIIASCVSANGRAEVMDPVQIFALREHCRNITDGFWLLIIPTTFTQKPVCYLL